MIMKICLLVCFLFFFSLCVQSQQYIIIRDAGGLRLDPRHGTVIPHESRLQEEGTTSIPETNCSVSIVTKDKKVYRNFKGRLDLRFQKLVFTVDDEDLVCTLPLEQIIFDSCEQQISKAPFKNGFPAIDEQTQETFYQVLTSGKTALLKFYGLKWIDSSPYNANTTIRKYQEVISYYLLNGNIMTKLVRKNSNLLSLIQVPDSYLKANKLSLTREDDIIEIVRHYNSL